MYSALSGLCPDHILTPKLELIRTLKVNYLLERRQPDGTKNYVKVARWNQAEWNKAFPKLPVKKIVNGVICPDRCAGVW